MHHMTRTIKNGGRARGALFLLAALITLAACGGGGGNPTETSASSTSSSTEQAPTLKASDYFAANAVAGDHLVYVNAEDSAAWNASVEMVASQQTTGSTSSWVINNMKSDGTYGTKMYLEADSSGLWSSSKPIDPTTHADAQKWLPAEFKLGDTFVLPDSTTTTHATDESGTPYTVTQIDHIEIQISGTEDITTPAGDFKNCLKAVEKMTSTTTQVKNGIADSSRTGTVYLTTWYAPGIGKAREIYDDGFPTTTELYAYVIAGIGNEQIRPTATIGDVMRTGQMVDTRIFAIQFSEPMLLTTVNSDSVQVIDPNGQQVPITVSSSTLSNSLTVEADASYTPISGIYQIKLNDKIQDLAGNALVPLEQSLDVTIPQACCNGSGATIYLWAH